MDVDDPVRLEVEDMLDKLIIELSKEKDLPDDHAGRIWLKGTLAINLIAMMDVGVQIRWDGLWREDEKKALEQVKNECSEKINVVWKDVGEWMNKHTGNFSKNIVEPRHIGISEYAYKCRKCGALKSLMGKYVSTTCDIRDCDGIADLVYHMAADGTKTEMKAKCKCGKDPCDPTRHAGWNPNTDTGPA
jgi:hypothetical protein